MVKDAVNSSAGALVPPGINSGEAPLANVSNPLGDAKVDQTITVVNGQTPNLNVGPIHITGVSDPQAAVKAAGAEFGDGVVEQTYIRSAYPAENLDAQTKIVLTGTPAARPEISGMRMLLSKV